MSVFTDSITVAIRHVWLIPTCQITSELRSQICFIACYRLPIYHLKNIFMKTEIREVYRCDYCNKLYQRKHAAIQHENVCSKNPNNKRACIVYGIACDYLTKKRVWHYYDTPFGEGKQEVDLLYCGHKKIFLYPPKVEAKKNWFELGDELNEPMPKKCDEYKLSDYDMCLMHHRG